VAEVLYFCTKLLKISKLQYPNQQKNANMLGFSQFLSKEEV